MLPLGGEEFTRWMSAAFSTKLVRFAEPGEEPRTEVHPYTT